MSLKEGLYRTVQYVYEQSIRPYLPRKIATYAGIPVRKPRLFDIKDCYPNHIKRRLIQITRDGVNRGDDIVVVGGGQGLAAAAAANMTGPSGCVYVYEASKEHVGMLEETFELNAVTEWTRVNHAIVGTVFAAAGEIDDPDLVDPEELPECNVLQLDCEGAELEILQNMMIEPDRIIVETHPKQDVDTETITSILIERGYSIEKTRPEPVEGDILLAKRN